MYKHCALRKQNIICLSRQNKLRISSFLGLTGIIVTNICNSKHTYTPTRPLLFLTYKLTFIALSCNFYSLLSIFWTLLLIKLTHRRNLSPLFKSERLSVLRWYHPAAVRPSNKRDTHIWDFLCPSWANSPVSAIKRTACALHSFRLRWVIGRLERTNNCVVR